MRTLRIVLAALALTAAGIAAPASANAASPYSTDKNVISYSWNWKG